jgi:hypothetical protein
VALAFSSYRLRLSTVDHRSGDIALARTAIRSMFTILPTRHSPNAIAVKAFKVQ